MPIFRKKCMCLHAPKEEVDILDYSHCNLTDIPSDVFLHERTLVELLVDNNRIHDLPRQLFYCQSLRRFSLSENEVKEIPPVIGSLSNLEFLDISKNAIEKVPDSLDVCKRLRILEASVNPLENIPEGLTRLVNLSELYLNDCFLESLPSTFGRLSQLKILELRENRLKTLPNSMSAMTVLERLDIGMNQFSELPEVLNNCFNLQELWLDNNSVSILPEGLGRLTKLLFIDASQNEIEHIAPEIEQCISLSDLDLSHNNLQTLPESFGRLSNMTNLRLDTNCLTALPFSIGGLVSLVELDVSVNNLEEIPIGIGLLRRLRTFRADDNFIMHIPPEIGSCGSLTILSLRSNSLTYIPDEIGHITHLHVLSLSDNKLTYLPFGLTKLRQLKALWLADSQVKPLMHLQRDTDRKTGQKFLTCYLLPQQSQKHYDDGSSFRSSSWEENSERRRQIHFNFEDLPPEHTQLYRTPTPYPKELKQRIQRIRSLAAKHSMVGEIESSEAVTGRRMQRMSGTSLASGSTRISSRPDSPRLTGRHALLKADKEKTLKDKARMQKKDNREMRSESSAVGVSSDAIRPASRNTSHEQTEMVTEHQESVGESNNNNTLQKIHVNDRDSAEIKRMVSRRNPSSNQATRSGSTNQISTPDSMNEFSESGSSQNQVPRHGRMQQSVPCSSINDGCRCVSGKCDACSARGHLAKHLECSSTRAESYRHMEHFGSYKDQVKLIQPVKGQRGCVDPAKPMTYVEGQSLMFPTRHSPDELRTGTLPISSSKAVSSDNVNSANTENPGIDNGGIELMSYGEFVGNMVAAGRRFPSGSMHRDRRYPPPVYSYRYHPRQPSSSSHGRRHGYDSDTGHRSDIGNRSRRGYDSETGCRGEVGYRSDSECFHGNRPSSSNFANRKPLPHPASKLQQSASDIERSVLSGSRSKMTFERPAAHEMIREESETPARRDAWRRHEVQTTLDGKIQVVEEQQNLAAGENFQRMSNNQEDRIGTKTKVRRKSRNMIPIEL